MLKLWNAALLGGSAIKIVSKKDILFAMVCRLVICKSSRCRTTKFTFWA